mgnify:CR=1 FL=1
METFTAVLAALLDVVLAILDKLDAARAAEFRRRCAADPAGVLLQQLNPGSSSPAGAEKSATGGTGRKSGAVDE